MRNSSDLAPIDSGQFPDLPRSRQARAVFRFSSALFWICAASRYEPAVPHSFMHKGPPEAPGGGGGAGAASAATATATVTATAT